MLFLSNHHFLQMSYILRLSCVSYTARTRYLTISRHLNSIQTKYNKVVIYRAGYIKKDVLSSLFLFVLVEMLGWRNVVL